MPIIISVSRREDVPAFRGAWFEQRLALGFAEYRNPFSGAIHAVSLTRQDVACFVFWSKNYAPFLGSLESLDTLGFPFVCHFTVNSYPAALEPRVPHAQDSIAVFRRMSRRWGAGRVIWRYDPIIMTSVTDERFHLLNFANLAASLEGATSSCVISFASIYAKVRRSLDRLALAGGPRFEDPEPGRRISMASEIAGIAARHGIRVQACCNPDITGGAVAGASCVDAGLIAGLFEGAAARARRNPTRKGCGCSDSRDIGEYGSCGHGCVYCYAARPAHGPAEKDLFDGLQGTITAGR